jgi:hypothetical protein
MALQLVMDSTPLGEREASLAALLLAGGRVWLCETCLRTRGRNPDVLSFTFEGRASSCLAHGERVEVGFHEALGILVGPYASASPRMQAHADALAGRTQVFVGDMQMHPPKPLEGESAQAWSARVQAWQDQQEAAFAKGFDKHFRRALREDEE